MTTRGYISWKTKYASALLALRHIPYDDAKYMTEDQIISLYNLDHNILYETGDPNRDAFWNLTPLLIREHREKTKQDAKVIAKSRRIRKKWPHRELNEAALEAVLVETRTWPKPKLASRGFDKTLRKKINGTVQPRRTKDEA